MNLYRLIASFALGPAVAFASGCSGASATSEDTNESTPSVNAGAVTGEGDTTGDSAPLQRIDSAACTTRVTYGDAWLRPANHPNPFDDVSGSVLWDGTCTNDGNNSFATLSNGWKPYFAGRGSCVVALDTTCSGAPACTTRVTYGSTWLPAPNHPAQYDEVPGRVFWDRSCTTQGSSSFATLSNGWAPHFNGANACEMSFMHSGCGGLYQNSVLPGGCADPGVLRDGNQYIIACTSGGAADAFPLYTSTDLTHFTPAAPIFPSGRKPSWATGDFWAPEIHRVGSRYVAYFSARHQDGRLSIGAATASSALGPFTDIGQPLIHDAKMGMIDVTEFEDTSGARYLVWKEDGNAVGQPTPIYGQALSADGTSLVGARSTLITNNLGWEGGVVEGPWVIAKGGFYYLFYSGNAYYNGTYAVGVARASAPLGPYQKASLPILKTNAAWVGPGHCSVVDGPSGDTYMVYHAWQPGHVNGPGDARLMLVDSIVWNGGWPTMPAAPSVSSRPAP